ncbi:MAG: glycosyltransferase [Deltaproteobacteria bacterium]|nr:glycosyltransferase [Deltaproteobacteria bacterium]
MRQFLYISPYFPPQTQVGALRPLKFVRQLPSLGWQPVVLCDLWPTDGMDAELERFVPDSVEVIRDFSHRAAKAYLHLYQPPKEKPGAPVAHRVEKGKPLHERLIPQSWQNPELVPLSEHGPDMPWAYRAAKKVLKEHPKIEAIVVNADPFAAAVVGAKLAQATGLPLIQDFRDIWAPCKLRRPRRLPPQRWLEDKLERYCFDHADHMVINTQVSLDDYRAFYPDIPASKWSLIRNFFDGDLVSHGSHPGFDRWTLLHLGNFSRFRIADPLVRAVARALELGLPREQIQVVSTGAYGQGALQLAAELGVADLFKTEKPLPYHQIGAICQAADVLVYIAEPGADQRIASKFYDYLGARRPVLSVSDNPESGKILDECQGGAQFGTADVEAMAAWLLDEHQKGRHRTIARSLQGLTAAEAAQTFVGLLEQVTANKSSNSKK